MQHTAFRYMKGFECLGGACPDTCCSNWSIVIDQPHYDSLKKTMGRTGKEREEFEAKYQRVPEPSRSTTKHALAILQPTGDCSFLAVDRSCSVQARYGEKQLSDTCAIYPRSVGQVGARYEVAGSPSCPEVARRLLTMPDAMALDEAPGGALKRPIVQRQIGLKPLTPYERHHDSIRAFACDVLSVHDLPVESRLFLLTYFAHHTVEFLGKDAAGLDDAKLVAAMAKLEAPRFRQALHEELGRLKVPGDRAVALVLELLALRAQNAGPLRLLAESAVHQYSAWGRLGAEGSTIDGPPDAASVLRGYQVARRSWEDEFGAEMDLYLTNYAKNYWAQEWYTTSANLLVHSQNLLLRVAILRFMVFGHPALLGHLPSEANAGAREGSSAARRADFEVATIDSVQKFSRHFEHDPSFIGRMEARLAEGGLQTLAYSVMLLRT